MGTAGVPSGEVTLVFTDMEGSTRLLHELGDGYLAVLAEHHDRIRRAVAAHGGLVVRTEGDSFFLAFAEPVAAVAACLAAQLSLAQDGWPHGGRVRVRMGIHRGPVATLEVDGEPDYVGLSVHEAARVTDAATGGTVLVTEPVAAAVRERLPDGATLEDVGHHLLRDFPAPCRLFTVSHPDLAAPLGPVRAAPAGRSRLPAPPAPLIGRDDELRRLAALVLGDARLVTVTGPGGVGKTRLALEVAWHVRSRFNDGPWFVDLATVTDADGLVTAIANAVGVAEQDGDALAAILSALGITRSLLVLDNVEQIPAAPGVIADLLAAAPELTVLTTSRERLRLRAEHAFVVDGLPPDDAVELLRDRAAAAGRALDDRATAADSRDLVAYLDGLPLAIELVAARVAARPVSALLDELRRGLDALAGGPVDLPARQQTMWATIEWSAGLLSEDERAVFESLAVFAGGASLPEIGKVAAALGVACDVGDLVVNLMDKSLVRPADGKPDRPRVALLEVVRQFAEAKLQADPVRWHVAVDAHVASVTALVLAAEPHLEGPEQSSWLAALELDHENIRVALDRAPEDAARRLALALPAYWTARGHWSEARRVLARILAAADDAGARAALAYYCERQGDLPEAENHATVALASAERVRDRVLCARAANVLGDVAAARAEIAASTRWYEKALAWADEAGDRSQRATALGSLGVMAWQHDRVDEARQYWTAAFSVAEQLGHERSLVILNSNLGLLDRLDGDLDSAEARFRHSLNLANELADPIPTADAYLNLGVLAKDRGDEATARDLYMEALTIYEHLGHVRYAAVALLHLAMATDDLDEAKRWVSAARVRAVACDDHLRVGECDDILTTLAEIAAETSGEVAPMSAPSPERG